MNETDIDILLALAEGRLSGQAEQDALEQVANNTELSAELSAQVSAMKKLHSIEPASMSTEERATLRANLIEQLSLDPKPALAKPQKAARPWWLPVFGLASAAVFVFAIVIVPSMFESSDDASADIAALPVQDESAESADTATASATTSAAAGVASDDLTTVTVAEVAQEDVTDYFSASGADPEVSALEQTSAEDAAGSGDEVTTTAAASAQADDGDEEPDASRFVAPTASVDQSLLDGCLDTLTDQLPEGDLILHAATTSDDGQIVHLGLQTVEGIEYSVSIDLNACTITAVNP